MIWQEMSSRNLVWGAPCGVGREGLSISTWLRKIEPK